MIYVQMQEGQTNHEKVEDWNSIGQDKRPIKQKLRDR